MFWLMLVISTFLFSSIIMVWLSPLAKRWANVSKFLQICGTEPTIRQPKQNVWTPASFTVFLNNISDVEIVHFFYYRDLNVAVGPTLYSGNVWPTFESLMKYGTLPRFANRNKTISWLFIQNCLSVHVLVISKFLFCHIIMVWMSPLAQRWANVWKFQEIRGAAPTFREQK